MALTNINIVNVGKRHEGHYHASFEAEFTGGRKRRFKRNYYWTPDPQSPDHEYVQLTAHIQANIADAEQSAADIASEHDRTDAFIAGVTTDYGEASKQEVFRKYVIRLRNRYKDMTPFDQYKAMKRFMPALIAEGLTAQQYADYLGIKLAHVQKIWNRWQALDAKATELQAIEDLE